MDALECIKTRMSIRKFKSDPVPKNILMEVVEAAKWSPSYKNTQPWEVIILSGAAKESLSKMMLDLLEKGTEKCPDIPEPGPWPKAQQERIAELVQSRKEKFGIDLGDPKIIIQAKKVNFNFYGAPHAIYLYQDASLSQWSLFDIGLFAQSLMLAAHASGLGTVPQAFVTDYSREIKKFLSLPETKRIVLGLSIGYPDMEAPANLMRTTRVKTEEIAAWVE